MSPKRFILSKFFFRVRHLLTCALIFPAALQAHSGRARVGKIEVDGDTESKGELWLYKVRVECRDQVSSATEHGQDHHQGWGRPRQVRTRPEGDRVAHQAVDGGFRIHAAG